MAGHVRNTLFHFCQLPPVNSTTFDDITQNNNLLQLNYSYFYMMTQAHSTVFVGITQKVEATIYIDFLSRAANYFFELGHVKGVLHLIPQKLQS